MGWALLLAVVVLFAVGLGAMALRRLYLRGQALFNQNLLSTQAFGITDLQCHREAIDDCHIRYFQVGVGPTVVLLHGIGASAYIWRYLLALGARHFHFIAIDLPGFGGSSKSPQLDYGLARQGRRVAALLDHLNVHQATLVGSSMGGAIALWMALAEPERFPKVVGLAPAVHPRMRFMNLSHLRLLAWPARLGLNRRSMRHFLGWVMARMELITEDCIEQYLWPYRDRDGIHAFWLATRSLQDPTLIKNMGLVRSSCLLLYGQKDRLISQAMMAELAQKLPHAKLEVHALAGHHIMEDDPQWVLTQLRRFVEE